MGQSIQFDLTDEEDEKAAAAATVTIKVEKLLFCTGAAVHATELHYFVPVPMPPHSTQFMNFELSVVDGLHFTALNKCTTPSYIDVQCTRLYEYKIQCPIK